MPTSTLQSDVKPMFSSLGGKVESQKSSWAAIFKMRYPM